MKYATMRIISVGFLKRIFSISGRPFRDTGYSR